MQLFFLLFALFALFLQNFSKIIPHNFRQMKTPAKSYFRKITNSSSISSQFARKKFISCQYPAPKRPYS